MTEAAGLTVAVTDLARFCHRRGDIDFRFGPSPSGAEGVAGHQRLYRRRPASYQSEYAVEYHHRAGALTLLLRGRADGFDPDGPLVEEIKTTRANPDNIPPAVAALHRAQGCLYAAIIARQADLPAVSVRVTWLNIDTDRTASREETLSRAALDEILDASLERFGDWLAQLAQLRRLRNASIESLPFPHGEFRAGQRAIAELAYKCIDQGSELLVEAPTGIGKTAAFVYPALKALATGKHDKLVFVTARTVGARAAEDTLARCRGAGFRGSALSLTAKERICLSPGRACHGDDCPYARGYYDKLPAALDAALLRDSLGRADLEELGRQHEVCPYQLGMDLLPWADVVIGDLHYVYGLGGVVGGLMGSDGQRWSVLLDEAHNLPGRARRMYSAALRKADVIAAKKVCSPALARPLERINRQLLALQNSDWDEDDYHCSDTPPQALLQSLQAFTAAVGEAQVADPACLQRQPAVAELFYDVLQCLRVAELWDDDFRCQLTRGRGRQSLRLGFNCVDPSRLLAQRQQRAHAVTAFSATLSPLAWSRASLGLDESAVCMRAASPFAPQQLQVTLGTGLDTRWHRRADTLPQLARALGNWLATHPGNCILYFPSYRYLEDCLALLRHGAEMAARHLWVQQPDQADSERERFLDLLAQRDDVAALCILGGVYGEGIDLPGDQLASVVVVGVGMPQVNRDTRLLQDWHQRKAGAGFDHAYLFPGMQKVVQALGRVVRGPRDHGAALLLDTRYASPAYRDLLPPWWQYTTAETGHK